MKPRLIRTASTYVKDINLVCKCGNTAVAMLEIHAIHQCTPENQTMANLLCAACLKTNLTRAEFVATHGLRECGSCGMAMVTSSDIIVRVCDL